MPKEGFKSITVNNSVYGQIQELYLEHKDALMANGVGSFTGFCIMMFSKGVEHWTPPSNPLKIVKKNS